MSISAAISLCMYFLAAINFSHEIQESKELYEQLGIFNSKIAPIAEFGTKIANVFNNIASGNVGEVLGLEGISLGNVTVKELLHRIFQNMGLPEGTDIDGAIKELVTSLGLNENDTLDNSKARNDYYQPFVPVTDGNGSLPCHDSESQDFCFEDPSYPRWYTISIEQLAKDNIETVLPAEDSASECKNRPQKECPSVSESGRLATANFIINKRKENRYLLQTDFFEQLLTITKCASPDEKCKDASLIEFPCESVTDNYSGGRSATNNMVLAFNSSGLVEVVAFNVPDNVLCWCKCKDDDFYS